MKPAILLLPLFLLATAVQAHDDPATLRRSVSVNGQGEVVGIASLAYAPLNFNPGDVPFAVPVQAACERVLTCGGDVPGAGGG